MAAHVTVMPTDPECDQTLKLIWREVIGRGKMR